MPAAHKFAVGEAVQLVSRTSDALIPLGIYTVIRQLPAEPRELTYHVKSSSDGHERIVREGQLAAISGWTVQSPLGAFPQKSEKWR